MTLSNCFLTSADRIPKTDVDHDAVTEAEYELLKSLEIPVEFVEWWSEPEKPGEEEQRKQQLFTMVDDICTNLDYPVRETECVCLAVQCPNFGLELSESDIQWLRDGQPIVLNTSDRAHPSLLIENSSNRCTAKFVIPSVRKSDTGQYTIRLTSDGQERLKQAKVASCSDKMHVLPDFAELAFPRLRVQPLMSKRDIEEDVRDASTFFDKNLPPHNSFRETERATLEVRVNPGIRIQDYTWFFNGKPIDVSSSLIRQYFLCKTACSLYF